MSKTVSVDEVARHDRISDVWIVVNGNVYDITEFAPQHPGGPESESDLHIGTLSEEALPDCEQSNISIRRAGRLR